MDLGQAEMGIPRCQGGRDSSDPSAGLQLVDPFTSSIAQIARNRQYPSHIENIDDVYLAPHQRSRFPRIRWQTPYDPPQPAPSPYAVPASRRSAARCREHSQPPVTLTSPVMPYTEAAHISDDHLPYVSVDPRQYNDARAHSPLSRPPSGGQAGASLDNSFRYDSLNYFSRPSVDVVATPIEPPSSHNSNNAGRLPPNQVSLSESLPRKSSSSPPPVRPAPSLSRIASPTSSHGSVDAKNDIIQSSCIPLHTSYEVGPTTNAAVAVKEIIGSGKLFMTDILPRQLYLHCLFRLPYFYFSRVSRIFTEADLTLEEIHEMALQVYTENKLLLDPNLFGTDPYGYSGTTKLSPAYERLKTVWEQFIDTLIKEWKTLNIISVLLLSAIMTTFQIHGAAEDPVTRYLAFWSLICALTSLLYSCSFIIQFASMHKTYKAIQWAIEIQKMHAILWNVWVMLAMPMVWMFWSILAFIASMMSFLWRAQANLPPDFEFSVTHSTELGFRIFICTVLGLGVVYGILILITFWRYGSRMDEKWTRHVRNFTEGAGPGPVCRSTTTLPAAPRGRFNWGSTASSPQPRPVPPPPQRPIWVEYAEHVNRADHDWYRRHDIVPPLPPPISLHRSEDAEASRSTHSLLQYQPYMRPQPGTQLVRPPETQELQLGRSKSMPSLGQLSIPNISYRNKDTDTSLLPESLDPQLHRSTSSSSRHSLARHPISSKNPNNSVPEPSERQPRRFASDGLIRYSLTRHPIPVIIDPNNDAGPPPCPSYDSVPSNRLPLATQHIEEVDINPHLEHRLGSPLNPDRQSDVGR